jgi:hypothetical protein
LWYDVGGYGEDTIALRFVKDAGDRLSLRTAAPILLNVLLGRIKHTATSSDAGCLTRHAHDVRIRRGGLSIWRIPCTRCKAVFTGLPHFALRHRSMSPDMARNALLATHRG